MEQLVHLWMFGRTDLKVAIERLIRVGADGIDLSVSLNGRYNRPETLVSCDSRNLLKNSGLPVRVITPLFKRQDLDYCHPDKNIRNNAVAFTKTCIDLAVLYGAEYILISPSYIGREYRIHSSYEQDWERAVYLLREAAHYAGGKGVKLMLEPINRYMVSLVHTVEEGLRMISDTGYSNIYLVLDTFHMQIEEPDGVLGGIRRAKGKIGCVHLGDNNRKPPFYGAMNWDLIIKELILTGFNGCLSHEPVELYYNEEKIAKDSENMQRFENQLMDSIRQMKSCIARCFVDNGF